MHSEPNVKKRDFSGTPPIGDSLRGPEIDARGGIRIDFWASEGIPDGRGTRKIPFFNI